MVDKKLNDLSWKLNDYKNVKEDYVRYNILSGLLVADTTVAAVAALNSPAVVNSHPVVKISILAVAGTITTINLLRFNKRRKKLKLYKENLKKEDLSDYCDDSSMIYKPNEKLAETLDYEANFVDINRKTNIKYLAILCGTHALCSALQLMVGHYFLAVLWANTATMYASTYGTPLIVAHDTKKLIKQVKENGKVL